MTSNNDLLLDNEEELHIFVEFDDVNIEKYRNIHVLGIDTKNPLIQLDDTFFSGTFENPLGTHIFFEEDPTAHTNDPVFDKWPPHSLKYLTKSIKSIKAEHIYVKMKEGIENDTRIKPEKKDDDIPAVAFTSVAEAVDRFKKDWMMTYPDLFSENKAKSELQEKQSIQINNE